MSKKEKNQAPTGVKPKRKYHFPAKKQTVEAGNYVEALKIINKK